MSEYAKALLRYLRERRRCLLDISDNDDDGECERLHVEMVRLSSGNITEILRTTAILEKYDEKWVEKWASKQKLEDLLDRYPEAL